MQADPEIIREISKSIRENVKSLYLGGYQLSSLPKEIANLTKLEMLDLRHNQLTYLPKEIARLTRLTMLNLRKNKLIRLPNEISWLT